MTYLYAHQSPRSVEDYFTPADIHEAAQVEQDDHGIILVLSAIWTALHGLNLWLTLWDHIPFWLGAFFHLLLGFFLLVVAQARRHVQAETRFTFTLAISTLMTGVIGAAGTFLAALLLLFYSARSRPFIEWYRSIFPELKTSRPEAIYELLLSGREENVKPYSVVPFMDVMALGTERQKRQAISRVTEQFDPSFAPVLQLGLKDPSNSIRVQTAVAITKIENRFTDMLMKIEKLERERPKDGIVKKGLARYYDDYAFTGILDPDREQLNRSMALKKYKEYLELAANDQDARVRVGRLLLRSGKPEEAIDWFGRSYDLGNRDRSLVTWYLEALFQTKRFDTLRRLAGETMGALDDIRQYRPRLALAIQGWAGGAL